MAVEPQNFFAPPAPDFFFNAALAPALEIFVKRLRQQYSHLVPCPPVNNYSFCGQEVNNNNNCYLYAVHFFADVYEFI